MCMVRPSVKSLHTILVLARASNLPTVWTNVIAAWFLAGGDWSMALFWMCLGGSLLYIGGMTLNDAFDAKWDREHGKQRPIMQGRISERAVWILGIFWMVAGCAILLLMARAVWFWLLALVVAILLYNAIHKRWAGSCWIMGACRFLLFLTAATACDPVVTNARIWFFGIALMVYIAGITLAARSEDTGGDAKTLAWLFLIFPVFLAPAFLFPGVSLEVPEGQWLPNELPIKIGLVLVFASWIGVAWKKMPRIGAAVGNLLAGIVLVDALAVATVDVRVAVICAAALPVNLLFQRVIPAT